MVDGNSCMSSHYHYPFSKEFIQLVDRKCIVGIDEVSGVRLPLSFTAIF